jgi:hypothetical protein
VIAGYFTDTISLVGKTYDDWNRPTDTLLSIRARVDKSNVMMTGQDGERIVGNFLIFVPSGTAVAMGDRVKITKIRGTATGDNREYVIMKIFNAGGFGDSHLELTV